MRTIIIVAAALAATAAGAQAPAGAERFCDDLARIVVTASEDPAFASLGERTRLGETDRCQVFTDHTGQRHVHCIFAWTISSAPLGGDRFAVEGSAGVEVAAITLGCQRCRGGEALLLVVVGPAVRR